MATRGADILGVGMMTAVGAGAAQTTTSVRAGIARLSESPVHNRSFAPMIMATVPDDALPPLVPAVEKTTGLTSRQLRMLRLAAPALVEALGDEKTEGVPLFLAVPEALPDRPDPSGPRFLELLAAQSGVPFAIAESRLFPNGRAGGLLALAEAMKQIESGARRAIVGGVDSYLDLYLLAVLDAESRILAEGVLDAFAPGEGAAFLLLGPAGAAGAAAAARVSAVAVGIEKGHRYSEEPYRGDGLAETLQGVFAPNGDATEPVRTVFAGLNGESFGAKEWGVAYLRSRDRFAADMCLHHPVDCFGDAGAALGPLLLGLGAADIGKGTSEGPCLVWCSSDREERGAALLRRTSA